MLPREIIFGPELSTSNSETLFTLISKSDIKEGLLGVVRMTILE